MILGQYVCIRSGWTHFECPRNKTCQHILKEKTSQRVLAALSCRLFMYSVRSGGFQPGMVWPSGKHWAVSEDTLVVIAEGWALLPSSGWRPGVLLTTLQCSGQPPTKNDPIQDVSCTKAKKPCSRIITESMESTDCEETGYVFIGSVCVWIKGRSKAWLFTFQSLHGSTVISKIKKEKNKTT